MKDKKNIYHILLVEDDDDDYRLIEEAFKKVGDIDLLRRAIDGEEAINIISGKDLSSMEKPNFGLVILDLLMPRKNGLEVLKELKSNSSTLHLPVVMLSSSTDKDHITESYKLGVNSFIKKPENFQDLVEVIDSLYKYWLNIVKLPKLGQKN